MDIREIILLLTRNHIRDTGKEPRYLYLSQMLMRELSRELSVSAGSCMPDRIFGLEPHVVVDREFYIKVH